MPNYKRLEYTNSDRLIILKFIMEYKCYNVLRGNRMWQTFAQKKLLPHTWQSLKEHFKKKIINNINNFEIPEKEKKLIKEGWMESSTIRTCRDNKKIKRTKFDFDAFSDEDSPPVSRTRFSTLRNNIETTNKLISKEIVNEQTDECVDKNTEVTDLPSTSRCNKETKNNESAQHKVVPEINFDSDSSSSLDLLDCRGENNKLNNNNNNNVESLPNIRLNTNVLRESEIIVLDSEDECLPKSNDQEGDKNMLFSEEDIHLLYNITIENTQFKNCIDMIDYYAEVFSTLKTPAELKRRFTHYILPNIGKYIDITLDQMIKLYKDEGVDVPNNLKLLTQVPILHILKLDKRNNSQNTAESIEVTTRDFQTCDCKHTIIRIRNCSFCTAILENKLHVFFTKHDTENKRRRKRQIRVTEKLYNIFCEKFSVERSCVHYIESYKTLLHIEQLSNYKTFLRSRLKEFKCECLRGTFRDPEDLLIRSIASLYNEENDSSNTSSDSSTHSQNRNNYENQVYYVEESVNHDINLKSNLSEELMQHFDETVLLQENSSNYAESSNDTTQNANNAENKVYCVNENDNHDINLKSNVSEELMQHFDETILLQENSSNYAESSNDTTQNANNAENKVCVNENDSHDINLKSNLSEELIHHFDETILLQENSNNYAESSNDTTASSREIIIKTISPVMHRTDEDIYEINLKEMEIENDIIELSSSSSEPPEKIVFIENSNLMDQLPPIDYNQVTDIKIKNDDSISIRDDSILEIMCSTSLLDQNQVDNIKTEDDPLSIKNDSILEIMSSTTSLLDQNQVDNIKTEDDSLSIKNDSILEIMSSTTSLLDQNQVDNIKTEDDSLSIKNDSILEIMSSTSLLNQNQVDNIKTEDDPFCIKDSILEHANNFQNMSISCEEIDKDQNICIDITETSSSSSELYKEPDTHNCNEVKQPLSCEENLYNNIKIKNNIYEVSLATISLIHRTVDTENFRPVEENLDNSIENEEALSQESVNTQNFKPIEQSTPEAVPSTSAINQRNEVEQLNKTNENIPGHILQLFSDSLILTEEIIDGQNVNPILHERNYSNCVVENQPDNSICSATVVTFEHDYSILSKEISVEPEIKVTVPKVKEALTVNALENTNIENDSQYLESVGSQNTEFRNVIINMNNDKSDTNESFILTGSSDIYYTPLN